MEIPTGYMSIMHCRLFAMQCRGGVHLWYFNQSFSQQDLSIGGHVSYLIDCPLATKLGLWNSLSPSHWAILAPSQLSRSALVQVSREDEESDNHYKMADIEAINTLRVEFIWGHIKILLHFLPFLNSKMTQKVEIFSYGSQRHTSCSLSISWLFMTWWQKEPGHQ